MLLKDAIKEITGLRYMVDELNILTSAGRRTLLAQKMITEEADIEEALDHLGRLSACYADGANEQLFSLLSTRMMQLHDIANTIRHLSNRNVLTDIELFEIKSFSLLAQDIMQTISPLGLTYLRIPDLTVVIDLLDPEQKRIPHFYIYDRYSIVLAELRRRISLMINNNADEVEIEDVRHQAQREEDKVRKHLSAKLVEHADDLMLALDTLAYLDILIARADQGLGMGLVRPEIGTGETEYKGLFLPQLKDSLAQQGKTFQPVDIRLSQAPTLIMGANMAGKSVLLRSVALAQALFQFGCFVPASRAKIVPVEKISLSIGDAEDTSRGLSSYAAEMLRVNDIIQAALHGTRQLVLVDELARTTNPQEGSAIVCSVLDFLAEHKVAALVTSHYAVDTPCRKLRVKGFCEQKDPNHQISIENINNFIDYSLEEAQDGEVPHEAIRIAEIIGITPQLLSRIHQYIDKENPQTL